MNFLCYIATIIPKTIYSVCILRQSLDQTEWSDKEVWLSYVCIQSFGLNFFSRLRGGAFFELMKGNTTMF